MYPSKDELSKQIENRTHFIVFLKKYALQTQDLTCNSVVKTPFEMMANSIRVLGTTPESTSNPSFLLEEPLDQQWGWLRQWVPDTWETQWECLVLGHLWSAPENNMTCLSVIVCISSTSQLKYINFKRIKGRIYNYYFKYDCVSPKKAGMIPNKAGFRRRSIIRGKEELGMDNT